MKILMVRLESDCETKIHYELKLDKMIKSIQKNDSTRTEVCIQRKQLDDIVLRRTTAKIMVRLQIERNITKIEDSYSYARTKVTAREYESW